MKSGHLCNDDTYIRVIPMVVMISVGNGSIHEVHSNNEQ